MARAVAGHSHSFDFTYMVWTKRFFLALPFAIAAVLNVLMIAADRLHWHREQHIAGYGFLFATPWAWLIDFIWFGFLDHIWRGNVHSNWITALMGYVAILWIPAALYSTCLWLLISGVKIISRRHSSLSVPD
jgi:hypothetical protein